MYVYLYIIYTYVHTYIHTRAHTHTDLGPRGVRSRHSLAYEPQFSPAWRGCWTVTYPPRRTPEEGTRKDGEG
jgi:hypothetical protein